MPRWRLVQALWPYWMSAKFDGRRSTVGSTKIESVPVTEPAMRTFGIRAIRSSTSRQPPEQPLSTSTTTLPCTGFTAPVSTTGARPCRVKLVWPAARAASMAARIALVSSMTAGYS